MFFDIESDLDDKRYVTLMFILNASEDEARLGIEIETLRQSLRTSCAIELSLEDMLAMYFQGLISYWEADGKPVYSRDARDQDWVGLTFKGMAVLINSQTSIWIVWSADTICRTVSQHRSYPYWT